VPNEHLTRTEQVISSKIFVGNLNFATTDQELRELFGEIGEVVDVHIPKDRESGRPTPPKRSRSSTGAKSVAATCGSISLKTAPGRRASSATSDRHRIARTTVGAMAAATTAVVMVAPSTGRRSPKAVAEAFEARSEACSDLLLVAPRAARAPHTSYTTRLKISGEV